MNTNLLHHAWKHKRRKGLNSTSPQSKHISGWFSIRWFLTSLYFPIQSHCIPEIYLAAGHFSWRYRHLAWCSSSLSWTSTSSHPNCRYVQGYFTSWTSFSRPTFLVFKNCLLQIGQSSSFGLQILQMLCPFTQSMIGGLMYSIHTGHSSTLNRLCSRSVDWDCMLEETGITQEQNQVSNVLLWK